MGDGKHIGIVSDCRPHETATDVFKLRIELIGSEWPTAKAGQFFVLVPANQRSTMCRPFSVVNQSGALLTFLVKTIGKNTQGYAGLRPGDQVELYGPHGNPIPVASNGRHILVGGGIGAAGLIYYAKNLAKSETTVLLGGYSRQDLVGVNCFRRYGLNPLIITEVESNGRGMVTDLLKTKLQTDGGQSTVVACGPKPMLEETVKLCSRHRNPCIVVLEEIMACGFGSCKGCAVSGVDGSVKHVCSDGPAFWSDWIDWKDLVAPARTKMPDPGTSDSIGTRIDLAGLKLDYPTMNSSGCLGIEALESGWFDHSCLGALVTKGVTVEPRKGNKTPRVCETPAGMINSIGLENAGLDEFLSDELPRWLAFGKPVIVNISGSRMEEYEVLAAAMSGTGVVALEVNISCPNVKKGGMVFGKDPDMARQVITVVKQAAPDMYLIAKLTPNVTDINEIIASVVSAGVDAVSLVNTFEAMSIDPYTCRPRIAAGKGGLSGPAIRPMAVYRVRQAYERIAQATKKDGRAVPIIGMGGIEDGESAVEFLLAGANAVAAGTGGFRKRGVLFREIVKDMKKFAAMHGFTSVSGLVGSTKNN